MPDYASGTIELQERELDAIRMVDGSWIGPGADFLTRAIENGAFFWPRRIDRLLLTGVVIHVGDIRKLAIWLNQGMHGAQRYLNDYWPEAERQTGIPVNMPFRLEVEHGAHIQGRLLVEPDAVP